MRIISGYLKGKKINLPKDKKTRPLKDMVKESIFNILVHSNKIKFQIKNSEILDLFSGSEGSAVDNTQYAGGEEVGFNSPDSQLQQQRTTIVEQIMNEDVPDSVKRELFEKYGIDPYEYLQQGLISKK